MGPQPIVNPGPSDVDKLSDYTFNLAIENWPGYMSEKLVDAIVTGCAPIHVGPNPLEWGIPSEPVIRARPNVDDVLHALRMTSNSRVREALDAGQAWLSGPDSKALSRDVVLEELPAFACAADI